MMAIFSMASSPGIGQVTAPGAVGRLRRCSPALTPTKPRRFTNIELRRSTFGVPFGSVAASLTADHDAALTVVTLVVHERQAVGCCVPAATWNRELDAMVDSN